MQNMKKIISIFFMALMLMTFTTVAEAKNDKKTETIVFTVTPKMHCQNCENKIKTNIRYEKGVKDIVTDLKTNTVAITFDPAKTDASKIESAFKKIGYTASTEEACTECTDCSGNGAGSCCKNKE